MCVSLSCTVTVTPHSLTSLYHHHHHHHHRYNKNERGHEFFSAEKPEAVEKEMKAREDASFSKR